MSVGAYCFGLLKVADNYQLIGNSGDLGIWPVTLILNLHNIGYGFYLYTKFGEKIFICYKDMVKTKFHCSRLTFDFWPWY